MIWTVHRAFDDVCFMGFGHLVVFADADDDVDSDSRIFNILSAILVRNTSSPVFPVAESNNVNADTRSGREQLGMAGNDDDRRTTYVGPRATASRSFDRMLISDFSHCAARHSVLELAHGRVSPERTCRPPHVHSSRASSTDARRGFQAQLAQVRHRGREARRAQTHARPQRGPVRDRRPDEQHHALRARAWPRAVRNDRRRVRAPHLPGTPATSSLCCGFSGAGADADATVDVLVLEMARRKRSDFEEGASAAAVSGTTLVVEKDEISKYGGA